MTNKEDERIYILESGKNYEHPVYKYGLPFTIDIMHPNSARTVSFEISL